MWFHEFLAAFPKCLGVCKGNHLFIYLFKMGLSHNPSWLQIIYITKDDLILLIFLPPHSKC